MATDYLNYNGDRHTPTDAQAAPQGQNPLQAEVHSAPPVPGAAAPADATQPAGAQRQPFDVCNWRPDNNAPTAKDWFDKAAALAPTQLNLNQDGTYTAVQGDSWRGIAERELHAAGKRGTKREIDAEELRLKELNKADHKEIDCNKDWLKAGWTLKLSGDAPAPQPQPQPQPAELPPPRAPRPARPPREEQSEAPEPPPRQRRPAPVYSEGVPPEDYLGPPPARRGYQRYDDAPPPPNYYRDPRYDVPPPMPVPAIPMPFFSLNLGGGHHRRDYDYDYDRRPHYEGGWRQPQRYWGGNQNFDPDGYQGYSYPQPYPQQGWGGHRGHPRVSLGINLGLGSMLRY